MKLLYAVISSLFFLTSAFSQESTSKPLPSQEPSPGQVSNIGDREFVAACRAVSDAGSAGIVDAAKQGPGRVLRFSYGSVSLPLALCTESHLHLSMENQRTHSPDPKNADSNAPWFGDAFQAAAWPANNGVKVRLRAVMMPWVPTQNEAGSFHGETRYEPIGTFFVSETEPILVSRGAPFGLPVIRIAIVEENSGPHR